MEWLTILGIIAACCTTSAFLPQVIKTLKTKRTEDISLSMYIIFSIGLFLWMIYGIFLRDIPIIAANFVTLIFAILVLILKIRHG